MRPLTACYYDLLRKVCLRLQKLEKKKIRVIKFRMNSVQPIQDFMGMTDSMKLEVAVVLAVNRKLCRCLTSAVSRRAVCKFYLAAQSHMKDVQKAVCWMCI